MTTTKKCTTLPRPVSEEMGGGSPRRRSAGHHAGVTDFIRSRRLFVLIAGGPILTHTLKKGTQVYIRCPYSCARLPPFVQVKYWPCLCRTPDPFVCLEPELFPMSPKVISLMLCRVSSCCSCYECLLKSSTPHQMLVLNKYSPKFVPLPGFHPSCPDFPSAH